MTQDDYQQRELEIASQLADLDSEPFSMNVVERAIEMIVGRLSFFGEVKLERRTWGPRDVLGVNWRFLTRADVHYFIVPRAMGYFCGYQQAADRHQCFAGSTSRVAWYACERPFKESPEEKALLAATLEEIRAENDAWKMSRENNVKSP